MRDSRWITHSGLTRRRRHIRIRARYWVMVSVRRTCVYWGRMEEKMNVLAARRRIKSSGVEMVGSARYRERTRSRRVYSSWSWAVIFLAAKSMLRVVPMMVVSMRMSTA